MEQKATRYQRIIVGLLCTPIALIIDWLLLVCIYRIYESGINLLLQDWPFMIVLLFLGYLFNRSAYMLLRYANGTERSHLLHPRLIFTITVMALLICITILGWLILEQENFKSNKDINFYQTFSSFSIMSVMLIYALKVQYKKYFL